MATTAPAAAPAATAAGGSTLYVPATPEPGSDILTATVKFGMRPYADNTYFTCSIMLTSYKTTDQLKCIGLAVTFYGEVMLANPKLGLRTVKDYMESGSTFNDALKQALSPLVGKTVYIPPDVADKEFHEIPFKLGGLDTPNFVTMDDPRMLLLGKSERLDFMHPAGAPIAETMLEAGWTPGVRHGPAAYVRSWRSRFSAGANRLQQRLGRDGRLRQQPPDDGYALRGGRLANLRRAAEGPNAVRDLCPLSSHSRSPAAFGRASLRTS